MQRPSTGAHLQLPPGDVSFGNPSTSCSLKSPPPGGVSVAFPASLFSEMQSRSPLLQMFSLLSAFEAMTGFETGDCGVGVGGCIPDKCKASDTGVNAPYMRGWVFFLLL